MIEAKRLIIGSTIGCAALALGACSGSGNSGNSVNTNLIYETLTSTAAKTSTIGGVGIRANSADSTVEVVENNGSITHDTDALTLTDDMYTLTGPDGAGGTLSPNTTIDTSSYDYVTVADQAYQTGGVDYYVTFVGGIITAAADMPTTGTATYTGEAAASVITATTGTVLTNGTSTVAADFGAGTVDVTLDSFTALDSTTGTPTVGPVDTIKMTGMTINGNRFAGGTLATESGGGAVDLTGTNTTTQAAGAFFGYDNTNKVPDEVGGFLKSQGDSGIVIGGFVAD